MYYEPGQSVRVQSNEGTVREPHVAVIGAGITGLALTRALVQRGIPVSTFEATARPGGVIRSASVDGALLEYGPQRLRLSEPIQRIVSELSLEPRLRRAPDDMPLYVFADGALREVPRSIRAFLRTDLLSTRGKVRVLAEPVTRTGKPTETAGGLLRRKFGREAYRHIVEPLLGGIYASDPDTMPAGEAIQPLLELERRERSLLFAAVKRLARRGNVPPVISFDDGLAELPTALYDAHRDVVRLDTPVDTIRSGPDDSFLLDTGDEDVQADIVVVTVPAWEAAGLLGEFSIAGLDALDQLRYNPLAIVHLAADTGRNGLGYQVRRGEDFDTLGVTWNDALFDRDGVHTAFLGGAWDPDIVDRDPTAIGETAQHEFHRIMGQHPAILDVTILPRAIPAYDTTWNDLESLSLPTDIHLVTNYTGRIGVPGRIRAANRTAERIVPEDGKRL